MDISFSNIDPGWLEVILTGLGLVISISLGYQFGRRDPLEPCVTLTPQQALDLIRVYHRSVASDVVRCLRRRVRQIEAHGRRPTEKEFREMRREVAALIKERRELLRNFRLPWGRFDRVLSDVYRLNWIEQDYQELRRILLTDVPLLERIERVEKMVWETQMAIREQIRKEFEEHQDEQKRKRRTRMPDLF